MSYLVLARKWRPQSFEDVVGQRPIVRTLQNALARNRVSHAMIFSGVRGVGKTTLARIMAKALNCSEGPTSTPCNKCDLCVSIAEGSAIDLHEIDGASNRGIQEIRELKENIRFFPTTGRYKIIIIDEVHMLTAEAFNALLKTLEEPPEHVFFMFATTELHKIPITILSRCQRYELSRVTAKDLSSFFAKIATEEKVDISAHALSQIVREADGSVRDGLSLLDQVFSFADSNEKTGELKVTNEDVIQILGLVDSQIIQSLVVSLLKNDMPTCLTLLDEVFGYGVDLKRFATDLLSFLRSLLICKISSSPQSILDVSDEDIVLLQEMAKAHSQEALHNYFHLLMKGIEEMQYSKHPKLMLEMAFMKAAQSGNVVPVSDLLGRLEGMLQGFPVDIEPIAGLDAAANSSSINRQSSVRQPEISKKDPEVSQMDPSDTFKKKDDPPVKKNDEVTPPIDTKEVRKLWDDFIAYVMDRKKWMAHILKLNSGVSEENNVIVLKFDEKSDCKMLQTGEHLKILTEFTQDFFQRELKVKIKLPGKKENDANNGESVSAQEERRALANDPLVQMTTEIFDGRVTNIRTGPRSR